jgi:hypothetical protein
MLGEVTFALWKATFGGGPSTVPMAVAGLARARNNTKATHNSSATKRGTYTYRSLVPSTYRDPCTATTLLKL